MAEVTASSVYRHSMGDLTLHVVNLPNTTDHGDTYPSGIQGIVSVMAVQADASTGSSATALAMGVGAALTTAATGVVTVYAPETNTAITLWIISKS